MFRSDSLLSQIQFFVTIFFSVCLIVLISFAIKTGVVDYNHLKQRAHYQNLQIMDDFAAKIDRDYQKMVSVLKEKTKFYSLKNIKYLQSKNHRFVNRLNREYLIPSEYKKFKSSEISIPIDMKALQLEKRFYNELTECLKGLFENGRLCSYKPQEFYKNKPIFQQIVDLNLKLIEDDSSRGLYLSKDDFKKLDLLDGVEDDGFYNKEFINNYNHALAKFGVDLSTWGVIDTTSELKQTIRPFSESSKNHYSKNASMHWTETALRRSTFKLGEVPHVIMDHVQKLANFNFGPNANRVTNFGLTDMLWEVFPLDFFHPNSERVALYPSHVICVKLDKSALYKSIIARSIARYQSPVGIIVKIGDGADSVYSEVRDGHVLQEVSEKLKSRHNINVNEGEIYIPSMDMPEWLEVLQTYSHTDALIPKVHSLVHPFLGRQYLSYRYRKIDQTFAVAVYQSELSILKYFTLRWGVVLIVILCLFLYFKRILQDGIEFISHCINSILITSFDHQESQVQDSKSATLQEFEDLKKDIRVFQSTSKDKLDLMDLEQRLHSILNVDRKSLNFYLNEFYYACADTSTRFHWFYEKTINCVQDITLEPNDEYKDFVYSQLDTKIINIWFETKLNLSEIRTIQNGLITIIEKAYFESKLIEADQLHSDLVLAQKIQKDLFLISSFEGLFSNQYEFCFDGDKQLNFDFANYSTKPSSEYFYHASILNSGMGVALQTCHIKAYLEGLIDIYESPLEIMQRLTNFVNNEEFSNLYISIIVVKVEDQQIELSSAGHGGLYDTITKGFHSCPVPPIGIAQQSDLSQLNLKSQGHKYSIYDLQTQLTLTLNPQDFDLTTCSMCIHLECNS
ncbi:MAG: hypothetical protein KC646_04955 [Candidatus Cloacimonetes bacterium]|nr:hypothetical protein [Candidatus Cloacimonadota bacterium]